MKRMLLMRAVAQLIDLVVMLAVFVAAMMLLPSGILAIIDNTAVAAVISMAIAFALMLLLQWPFLSVGQTIGKALCSLQIVATDNQPLTTARLLRRELLLKFATLYFICLPMLAGEQGGQDEASRTQVIRNRRVSK